MSDGQAADWALLGIAPTQERRAIRVAYAQRLKAIDPETDPQAFIKLRNAYERVLAGVADPNAAPAIEEGAPPALAELSADPAPAEREEAAAKEEDASEARARAILSLLWGNETGQLWLAPEAQEALRTHWQALLADPNMERLDHADRVERWAIAVIAETAPLSVPILASAAERFGWVDADQDVHSSHQLAGIARRYRMLRLLDAAERPGSPHHAALIELRRPSSEAHSKPVRPYLVFELIAAMRYAHPQFGETLDPGRLETWELHAEDERTSYEQPDYAPPAHRLAGCLTILIIFALAIGTVVLLNWSAAE